MICTGGSRGRASYLKRQINCPRSNLRALIQNTKNRNHIHPPFLYPEIDLY
jgi:hypothetical protein